MPLSDEAIIGLIGLILACGPLAALFYRAKHRRRRASAWNQPEGCMNAYPAQPFGH